MNLTWQLKILNVYSFNRRKGFFFLFFFSFKMVEHLTLISLKIFIILWFKKKNNSKKGKTFIWCLHNGCFFSIKAVEKLIIQQIIKENKINNREAY